MKRALTIVTTVVVGLTFCGREAFAQYRRPYNNPYTRQPTTSPYLNLFRGGDPALNYHRLVLPELEFRDFDARTINTLNQLQGRMTGFETAFGEEDQPPLLGGGGHPTFFMHYDHYYPQAGGGQQRAGGRNWRPARPGGRTIGGGQGTSSVFRPLPRGVAGGVSPHTAVSNGTAVASTANGK